MQSGSLTKFSSSVFKLFTAPISLKKLYYWFLAKITGLKATSQFSDFTKFRIKIKDTDTLKIVKIKELNPVYVLVRRKTIECPVKINDNPEGFRINHCVIREIPPIFTQIKWKRPDISLCNVIRNHPISINKANINHFEGITLQKRLKVSQISKDAIELQRRLRTTEEIVTLSPYTKRLSRKDLYKIPVIKTPLYKSYFSEVQMAHFRELLANQAKTRRTNVEIISIYDKFSIDMFSSVRQNQEDKNLTCTLNEKLIGIDKDKLYYLIIGNRKDNNVTIKVLAKLEAN